MRFQPRDWSEFFRIHHWDARDVRYFAIEAERVRRPAPLTGWMRFLYSVVPQRVRRVLQRSFGYALRTRA